jgi:hypothetical protein
MVGKRNLVGLAAVLAAASMQAAFAGSIDPSRELPASLLQNVKARTAHRAEAARFGANKSFNSTATSTAAATSGLPGIDSLINWSDQFEARGFDSNGNPQSVWPYTMVGTPPESGTSSTITAPVVPVSVDLLNADGSVAVTFGPSRQIVNAVLQSPLFESYAYTSGTGQYNDQMMRAEFWERIDNGQSNWHNLLAPVLRTARNMQIPFLTPTGTPGWVVFVDANHNPILAAIDFDLFGNLLFPTTVPVNNTTPVGAAELAGDITTAYLSTFLFHNVVLFTNQKVANCCVVGYHTYDFEPGDASNGNRARLYVLNFNSWTSPGLFLFGGTDITAMSHEIAETFNDPFLNNLTPWWESVDGFTKFGTCQNDLEVGDVIEVLSTYPEYSIEMNGMTYHPQNEALFPWFAFQSHSSAHLHAYSFPDETTLRALSPHPLLPGCVAPPPEE